LEVGVEPLPRLERDETFTGAVRFVEAGAVVERRHPVEPERDVGPRTDELGTVDHARLQAGEDFAGRRRLRRGAKATKYFSAEPERAQLETLHVLQILEFAPEPAAHAHAGVAAHERLHAERGDR